MEEKTTETKQPRVRNLFEWESLSRPSFDYPKGAFAVFGGIVLLLTIVLVLFQEWLAIAVTWATYFLFFALTKVPQATVSHKITTEGIVSIDHSYIWQYLGPFWFKKRNGELWLHVAQKGLFGHLIMMVNPEDQEKITEILAEYLPYIEVPEKTASEKFSQWFEKNISQKTK